MLENAWIIPLIPAATFFLILFFGKRLPRKGSELGIAAVGLAFVLALVTNVQWFQHVNDAESSASGEAAPPAAVSTPRESVDGLSEASTVVVEGEAASQAQSDEHEDEPLPARNTPPKKLTSRSSRSSAAGPGSRTAASTSRSACCSTARR